MKQKKEIEDAWTTAYRGKAPVALWNRIREAMNQPDRYARYLAIVQSSGTGKSRMIEELSKTHLVIPVNLRGPFETGYPPRDKIATAYLSWTDDQKEARVHAVAFLRAVFKEVSKLITELRKSLPEGMRRESHGDKRQSFYDKVNLGAKKLEEEIKQVFARRRSVEDQLASVGICEAFEELIVALSSVSTSPRRHQADPEPLVILAFDDARTLANPDNDGTWSHFSELCRALHALNNQPLFSLFLTTTGNVNPVVPLSREDPSGHILNRVFSDSRPFAEVGFDHFAFKDQFDLRVVVGDKHISHFGRPLWATHYENGNDSIKSRIIQFVALKLCAGRTCTLRHPLNDTDKLACLAQRLPIEFHSDTYASKMIELELVEGHMRILLLADAGFESVTTVSSSEPLLSEAAYWMMDPDTTFKAAETLKSCLEGYAINKGDRGELLVMLLFTLARDRAIGHPDEYGWPVSGQRWCSVPVFMKALFEFKHLPCGDASLTALFAKSKIFFNHWVKVHQCAVLNVEYFAQLMRRGAALRCATNQTAIDGIIPFLLAGYTIFSNNMGVILWKVRNDANFTDKPDPSLFEAMDPYTLGILNPGDNIPIIRMVFALASKTPCLTRVTYQQDDFKSCDFWVGGISPIVFSPVGDGDVRILAALLQATYGWEDIYKNNPDGRANNVEGLRRSMNPGTAEDEHHWQNWADFPAIHNIQNEDNESMDED